MSAHVAHILADVGPMLAQACPYLSLMLTHVAHILALCWHQGRQDVQFSVPDPVLRPKTMKNPWFFNVAKMKPGDGEGHKTL